jgi:hypothetical protein
MTKQALSAPIDLTADVSAGQKARPGQVPGRAFVCLRSISRHASRIWSARKPAASVPASPTASTAPHPYTQSPGSPVRLRECGDRDPPCGNRPMGVVETGYQPS